MMNIDTLHQEYIGLQMLSQQAQSIIDQDMKNTTVSRLEDLFHQMWLNNGNNLSNLYSGTGALSQGGSKLLDGARSAARTIQNNLLDKEKQEAFDLLLLGCQRLSDFTNRASLVLPSHLLHGRIYFICTRLPLRFARQHR